MDFIPSQANPCISLRNNPKLDLYDHIAVYVDDLCIATEKPEELISIFKTKYKLKVKGYGKLTNHVGADYFHDPDGTRLVNPRSMWRS